MHYSCLLQHHSTRLIIIVSVLNDIYFIQAASVPDGLSSAPPLLGLSLCQHMLGQGWDGSLCIYLCRCLVRGPRWMKYIFF